jgi:tetratricopeptide (TPR) repeat protein
VLADAFGQFSMEVELLAGNPELAVQLGQESVRRYEEIGDRAYASTTAGILAEALYQLDRFDQAERWAAYAEERGASDDMITQMLWRQAKAKLLARRGEYAESDRLAREAVAIGERTDLLDYVADAYAALGEVLTLSGRTREAVAAFTEALERYQRKGNQVMAEQTRAKLGGGG